MRFLPRLLIHGWALAALVVSACQPTPGPTAVPAPPNVEARVDALLAQMTLAEKLGQMTQVEKNSLTPEAVTQYFIGSVLSGGGGYPAEGNTPAAWLAMTSAYKAAARQTRLGIPLLYGVDAVHGHNNLNGATIFPHNIGLGATRNAQLVEAIGRATAAELAATGVDWNFAPVVAVARDIRWGRAYEAFGEDPALVAELGAAYLRGLQSHTPMILGTAKHFVADGGTAYGTATASAFGHPYQLDQGDARLTEAELRAVHLPPYAAAIQAGARSIMVSFSSWNGDKVHGHRWLLTDLLKGELGFTGFLISDWQAIDQLPGNYHSDVVTALNAGLDMVMVPYNYQAFLAEATQAVTQGEVPQTRIDDAVRRILRVKLELGLFERPLPEAAGLSGVGAPEHRALARTAVAESLVVLKNDDHLLPLDPQTPVVFVAGQHANDLGWQSGGWTLEWQGHSGNVMPGVTLYAGLRAAADPGAQVHYDRDGDFAGLTDAAGQPLRAQVGVVVVGEPPYAEGVGDRDDLTLSVGALVAAVRARSDRVVLVIVSGRPLIITELLPQVEAVVAAWLPGSEGAGVADVVYGRAPFKGRLAFTWPRAMGQLPFNFQTPAAAGCAGPLFAFGAGLAPGEAGPAAEACPP